MRLVKGFEHRAKFREPLRGNDVSLRTVLVFIILSFRVATYCCWDERGGAAAAAGADSTRPAHEHKAARRGLVLLLHPSVLPLPQHPSQRHTAAHARPNLQVQQKLQPGQPMPQQQQGPQQSEIPPPPQSGQDFTLSSVLHYLQSEWRKYERDRNEWEIERAEMRVRPLLAVVVASVAVLLTLEHWLLPPRLSQSCRHMHVLRPV